MKQIALCSFVTAVLALLCITPAIADGQYNPACNCVPPIDKDIIWASSKSTLNFDSVSIDTCGITTSRHPCTQFVMDGYLEDIIRKENRYYSKVVWVEFTVKAIRIPGGVDVTWTSINSEYPALREAFRKYDSIMGGITFRKNCTICDPESQEFTIRYNQYYNLMELQRTYPAELQQYAPAVFGGKFMFHTSVQSDIPESQKFTVLPNPANETLTLRIENGSNAIKIFTPLGQIVYSNTIVTQENTITLDIHTIQGGMYFVKVNQQDVTPIFITR